MNINGKWYTEPQIEAYVTELENKVAELEAKHWNECRQIAHYDDELKDLREENKVLISECDRLIKEKGELLKKSEQIAEYKRLLKAAVEDLSCGGENNKCTKSCKTCTYNSIKGYGCRYFGEYHWRYADEALALIGEDTNVGGKTEGR